MKQTLLAASLLAVSCGTELSIDTSESALAPPGSNAALVSHTIPAVMAPGETRQVEVVMLNNGTVAWDTASWVLRNRGAGTWAYPQISVVPTVDPGESFAFRVLLTAPPVEAPFSFRARMINVGNGYFGPLVDVPVDVSAAIASDLASSIVSHTAPNALAPGEKRRVHLVMRNDGTRTWDANSFDLRRPGGGYFHWVSTLVPAPVAADGMNDFSFVITAPATDGAHVLSARMYTTAGAGFFGQRLDHSINVSALQTPERWWTEAGDTVPAVLAPSAPASFSITVRNNGSLPWSGNNWGLNYFTIPRTTWARGLIRLGANETIAPGATRTFNIAINAPAASGAFELVWEMMELGVDSVGALGPRGSSLISIGVPETTIDSGPSNPTDQTVSTFVFSSSAPGASFECAVDSDPYAACSSPYLTMPLADGPHTFSVRAIDGAVLDPTPAVHSWTVDTSFVNGSFESNYDGWSLLEIGGSATYGTWGIASDGQTIVSGQSVYDYANATNVTQSSPGLPSTYSTTDGSNVALLLVNGPEQHRLYQDTTLPACATTLSWDMWYRNHNAGGWSGSQYVRVHLRSAADDSILATLFDATGATNVPMSAFSADISAYAGQQVRIDFDLNVQTFYLDASIDNVRINCQ